MNATLVQLLLILAQQVAGGLFMIWFFRWRKREDAPNKELNEFKKMVRQWQEDYSEQIKDLNDSVVGLRGSVKYIEGRMNGKFWQKDV